MINIINIIADRYADVNGKADAKMDKKSGREPCIFQNIIDFS